MSLPNGTQPAAHAAMTDTDLTARLAEALQAEVSRSAPGGAVWPLPLEWLIAALLPVVREYGDQRAAEALEAVADAADDGDWQGQQYGTHPVTRLRARAAALRGEGGTMSPAKNVPTQSVILCGPPKGCTCPAVAWTCCCAASEHGRRMIAGLPCDCGLCPPLRGEAGR